MRIDAHQHFWTYDPAEYGWIGAEMGVLRRDFGPRDLEPLLAGFEMDGSIAVQARQTPEETRRLLELAREHPFVRGVVGWVDLSSDAVEDELASFAGDPKLVGVRHVVQDEPDDEFLLRADFRRGVGCLAAFGLVYDLLLFPKHLPVARRFVEELSEQPFVLDHLGKPSIREGTLSPWDRDVRALAEHPNVACKLSGMVTEAAWDGWTPEDFVPYLDRVYEAFGENRVLFGSDWPVCLLAADYPAMADVVVRWAERLDAGARAKLFGGNAARIYGLDQPA